MIGRPALRNPWIFRQLDELRRGLAPYSPSGADVVAHLDAVADRLDRTLGATRRGSLGPLKEHVAWLLRALPGGHEPLQQALRAPSRSELLATVAREIGPLPPAALDLDAWGPFRLERTPARDPSFPARAGAPDARAAPSGCGGRDSEAPSGFLAFPWAGH